MTCGHSPHARFGGKHYLLFARILPNRQTFFHVALYLSFLRPFLSPFFFSFPFLGRGILRHLRVPIIVTAGFSRDSRRICTKNGLMKNCVLTTTKGDLSDPSTPRMLTQYHTIVWARYLSTPFTNGFCFHFLLKYTEF